MRKSKTLFAAAALLLGISSPALCDLRTVTSNFDNGSGRAVPLTWVSRPGEVRGVIFFSHGAFSSPAKYRAIIDRWAESGFAVITPMHGDSTDWTGSRPAREEQTPWRLADMRLAREKLPALAAMAEVRLGAGPVVAAGHSFGALIALMDDRPETVAIIAFSPPGPVPGLTIPVVRKPVLTITGTADVLPVIAPEWQAHLHAHELAEGPAVVFVATDADHYFGGVIGRPELPGPRQQAQFDEALRLSAMFLDGFATGAGAEAEKLLLDRPTQGELRIRNAPVGSTR
jgi:dienelactone hydrolase